MWPFKYNQLSAVWFIVLDEVVLTLKLGEEIPVCDQYFHMVKFICLVFCKMKFEIMSKLLFLLLSQVKRKERDCEHI